jgi:hypothetical protein
MPKQTDNTFHELAPNKVVKLTSESTTPSPAPTVTQVLPVKQPVEETILKLIIEPYA